MAWTSARIISPSLRSGYCPARPRRANAGLLRVERQGDLSPPILRTTRKRRIRHGGIRCAHAARLNACDIDAGCGKTLRQNARAILSQSLQHAFVTTIVGV